MEEISEKRVAEVEKALGIKLYICQRDFILNGNRGCPNERCTGYTTAYCIKLLLTAGEPLKLWDPEQMKQLADYKNNNFYHWDFFRKFLGEHYKQLKAAGVETRLVEFKRAKDGESSHYNRNFNGSRFI